ncbi:MAG: DUF2948 family protein [Pseudomonadota bacterium]|nr:DUF2948 family protein [Pseudomonadota bacterium]
MNSRPVDLKLYALDREGLSVISAHAQDACVRRQDMTYLPQQKRFALGALRYDWIGAKHMLDQRVGAVLRFDRVLKVSHIGLDDDAAKVRNLLGVTFEKTEAPSGLVFLTFADGAIVRLEVECLEAELLDVGPRIAACDCEGHKLTIAEPD